MEWRCGCVMSHLRRLVAQARWFLVIPVVLVIGALALSRSLAGSPTVAGATGPTDPPAVSAIGPGPSATPAFSGCRALHIETDRAAPSVILGYARSVVRATVLDIDAQVHWATPDGSMPTGMPYLSALNTAYRTAHVRVTGVRSGPMAVDEVVAIRVQGGSFPGAINGQTDGCSTIIFDGTAEIVPGADVVLVIGPVRALGATPTATFDVSDAWAITNGSVQEPDGTKVMIQSLLAGA